MKNGTLAHLFISTAVALTTVTVTLSSGPRTGDDLVEQTEDNHNSQSVITLPASGPITVF